jgi:dipeptidyl aminopeptidase/acylaminoacyl peptidase
MSEKTSKPYGMWPSPIKPASLAQSLRLSDVAWDSDGETLVWLEGRSDRGVLVCAPSGQAPRDLTSTLSVRAMVGYGGGDMAVCHGYVYFVAQEGRLYRQRLAGGEAQPIVPQFGHMASPTPSPDGRWVIYVYTYERADGLAIVDAAGESWPQKLAYGQDFYMQPCWHPDSRRIAWISWDHPNMPWDSTALHLATLDTNAGQVRIAAQETLIDKPDVAIQQPQFSPDRRSLAYISDESGWGNLYLYDLGSHTHRQLTGDAVEAGALAWVQGVRTYGFTPDGKSIYYVRNEAGFDRLWVCNLASGQSRAADPELQAYSELSQIAVAPMGPPSLAFVASSSTVSPRIVSWTPGSPIRIHRRSTGETVPPDELATPQAVHWTAPNGEQVHGLYYPPTNPRFTGSGLPPAIVNIHGGPTGQTTASYSARAQFFATRGYAYLEVNYRGSTGYGKPYMAALRGKWGLLDVQDAIDGARHLVDSGLADEKRLVIMGGSAGGYTVLKALVDHPGFFKAALCLYGVSNMFTLAADTHKFEERYLDSMLGPLPEASDIYRERSPIFYADQIVDPIAVFQGEIDRVVPKAQSDTIVESLRRRGVPHEYHVYAGEGHGWRKQETIEAFYTTVESFLKQYVIFA